jgi:hypothetical protein
MLRSPTPPHYTVIAKTETHDSRRYHSSVYADLYQHILMFLSFSYRLTMTFQPTIFTRAARYRQPPIATVTPENTIAGPNPLAHVPGIIKAPEIGIPVNAAIELTAEINPNLD